MSLTAVQLIQRLPSRYPTADSAATQVTAGGDRLGDTVPVMMIGAIIMYDIKE